ncbi:hypothetical protein RISK_006175 [Rhodopirellula islandica]|uniref:Uncharacterized protein n=1 Tax=Rhodopirellula islandica TaxID=595434 RepID=A0A0J1B6A6_RHOIS|nr:hypothetical protein RISK_006173 [Rhodopirellula islandica]KLU01990.1 hypothetical protein RISK_006174 [Rhodopirellula islandica]KLU01991.1 hypothetical protein RISK_006175 [Rhodopirellula islandica]
MRNSRLTWVLRWVAASSLEPRSAGHVVRFDDAFPLATPRSPWL